MTAVQRETRRAHEETNSIGCMIHQIYQRRAQFHKLSHFGANQYLKLVKATNRGCLDGKNSSFPLLRHSPVKQKLRNYHPEAGGHRPSQTQTFEGREMSEQHHPILGRTHMHYVTSAERSRGRGQSCLTPHTRAAAACAVPNNQQSSKRWSTPRSSVKEYMPSPDLAISGLVFSNERTRHSRVLQTH